jgi:hypothetical protein
MAESADRRASERIPVSAGSTCLVAGRIVDDVGPVKIRDVSLDGIGLVLSKTIQAGTVLLINLANKSKNYSRLMKVKIVHVTPINGGFLAGGSFAEPLSYQEFTMLVM